MRICSADLLALAPLLLAVACTDLPPEVTDPSGGPTTEGTDTGSGSGLPSPDTDGPTTAATGGVDDSGGTTNPATTAIDTTQGSPDDSSSSGSGGEGCISIDIGEVLVHDGGAGPAVWGSQAITPGLGDKGSADAFVLELWSDQTGTIDLGVAPNDNYDSCNQCVRLFEDGDDGLRNARQYFQREGTLILDRTTALEGPLVASFAGVVLEEVTFDAGSATSSPVPDGQCIRLDSYETAPNNSCAGRCGAGGPVPGSFPTCYCNDDCDDFGDCCEDLCSAGVCDADTICTEDTDVLSDAGLGLTIPDDHYDGTLATMACASYTIEEEGINTVADVALELGIEHTWVGDLVIKVQSPAGTIVTVMSHPGRDEPDDDGGGGGGMGNDADLTPTHRVSFVDGAGADAEEMGSNLVGDETVCFDDMICEFDPNPGAATPGPLGSFTDENSAGLWTVCVGDGAGGDTGSIDFIELTIDQTN